MATAYPSVPGVRFKRVPGFPRVCAGDNGTVWAFPTKYSRNEYAISNNGWRQRKLTIERHGYYRVCLRTPEQKVKGFYVHVLVLTAFCGPRAQGMEGCHNDGNKLNNSLNNLRWDTARSNYDDRIRLGEGPRGVNHPHAKTTDDNVRKMRVLYDSGESITRIGLKFGVSYFAAYQIVKRRTWKHVS